MNASFNIVRLNYDNPFHTKGIVGLLAEYAGDPAIGSPGLAEEAKGRLIDEMAKRPGVVALLAVDGSSHSQGQVVGAAICVESFSTFAAKSVLNIHDIMVSKAFRGRGVGKLLIEAVEQLAIETDCAKITLEVYENNRVARGLYEASGFGSLEAKAGLGQTYFLTKPIR
ncbi:putative acetyltransferase [Planctomycetes bacterium CA13]|uniref:Putative acetyltransferase n=1 Tax=Novipirellula herctigrandis TaxID=2527986 RepID=A0A5C5Z206_9BACT|nr:putative acetyltransferase [Planctomycetes bacterium CA13]